MKNLLVCECALAGGPQRQSFNFMQLKFSQKFNTQAPFVIKRLFEKNDSTIDSLIKNNGYLQPYSCCIFCLSL